MKKSQFWDFVTRNVASIATVITAVIILIYQRVIGFSVESLLAGILLVLSLLATSELIDKTRKLETIDTKILGLISQLQTKNSSATVRLFEKADDGVAYIVDRVQHAQHRIDHVSLSAPIPRTYKSTPMFEKAIEQVAIASEVKIRYIANFADFGRLERVRKLLNNPQVSQYYIASVNSNDLPINMLNFIIIDDEIIFGIPGAAVHNTIISVRNESILQAFERYFVLLFDAAKLIERDSPIVAGTVI